MALSVSGIDEPLSILIDQKGEETMDRPAQNAKHVALLKRAEELLSRDQATWRPPLHRRVRWWNLALGAVMVGGTIAVLGPLRNPAYRQGFTGNLVSSAWQLIVGGLVGWIIFKRFKAERFDQAMSISWDDPFREMLDVSRSLYPMAIGEAADLRRALNTQIRKRMREAVSHARWKGALYGRFFEIEQIVDIDRSCDAAENLADIDTEQSDPNFMKNAVYAITDVYVYSSCVRGLVPSREIVDRLNEAHKQWSARQKVAS